MASPTAVAQRLIIERTDSSALAPDFAGDVLEGFSRPAKALSPMYFYDARGSRLFEAICELPEYYLTRTEHGILRQHAADIARYSRGKLSLVEFGSGSSTKTRLLIEALLQRQGSLHYVPIDISESILVVSARQLLKDYPKLRITAYASEYYAAIERIGANDTGQKMVILLGSNIGNFDAVSARHLLRSIRKTLRPNDYLLLSTDMQKAPAVLEAAYDDAEGITAEFNKNLLRRINRELDGEFDLDSFEHEAIYNPAKSRVEIYLRSTKSQQVHIGQLARTFQFAAGERIHTENSHKFSQEQIRTLCHETGFRLIDQWNDTRGYFFVNLLTIS